MEPIPFALKILMFPLNSKSRLESVDGVVLAGQYRLKQQKLRGQGRGRGRHHNGIRDSSSSKIQKRALNCPIPYLETKDLECFGWQRK
ncbi:unnamed protein product [Rhodiola kirilowii]